MELCTDHIVQLNAKFEAQITEAILRYPNKSLPLSALKVASVPQHHDLIAY